MARGLASRGADTATVVDAIVDCLGPELRPFTFISALFYGFHIPVHALRGLEEWDRLHPAGTMSRPEMLSILRPWVERQE